VKRRNGEGENFEFLILSFELSNRGREEEEGVGEEGKGKRGRGEMGKWREETPSDSGRNILRPFSFERSRPGFNPALHRTRPETSLN
jgi:hypothetical protein